MKFGSLTTTTLYRVMSITAPILCLGVAIGMSSYEVMRVRRIERDISDVRTSNADARTLIQLIEKEGATGYISTKPDSREEQVEFVNSIRKIADKCNVKLTQWATSTAGSLGVPDAVDEAGKQTLARVQPVANQIGLTGAYPDIRSFIDTLQHQDRLVTISTVKWLRASKPPETAVTMVVTRYIMMTAPVSKPSAAGASSPTGIKS